MFSQIGPVSTFLTVNPPGMHYQERHAGRTGGKKSQTCGLQKTALHRLLMVRSISIRKAI